jgi:hypothetical protein
MTGAAEGRSSQIQPATNHSTCNTSHILETKEQEQHHLTGDANPSPDSYEVAPKLADGGKVKNHRGEEESEHYST